MIWTSYTDRPRRRHLGLALLAASLLVALLAPGAPALASETEPLQAQAAATAQESGQRGEPEANLPYLFAVYIITWLAFFGYVFFMSRRQRDMQREIDELKRAISESESRGNTWG
jgi:CcmD family protein